MPTNHFKQRLTGEGVQYGIWVSFADPVAAEISAGAGFDWLVIDGEHSPNDIRTSLAQLQAVTAYPVSPIVRLVRGDTHLVKQYLDIGFQTILVPMIETAEHATRMVQALRYPPHGVRGVATGRAARWGRVDDYFARADDEACLVLQIETLTALDNLDEILAVEGVDAFFVGPSDLGAALGHLGRPGAPEVVDAVADVIGRIRAANRPCGVLGVAPHAAARYREAGANFIGVAIDTALLAATTSEVAARFTDDSTSSSPSSDGV